VSKEKSEGGREEKMPENVYINRPSSILRAFTMCKEEEASVRRGKRKRTKKEWKSQ
jgi:hypothetical protein